MTIVLSLRLRRQKQRQERRLSQIYAECRQDTMIPEPTFRNTLQIAEKAHNTAGCVVECGVWRGGMIAGLCRLLGTERTYYLFDSFEGLPPAQPIDGPAAADWQRDTTSPDYYDNCRATVEQANSTMLRSGARRFHIVPGWFNETLPVFAATEPIAVLHLDADWYDSTMACLVSLFERVAVGGLIILDDYLTWDGCSRALHDFLSGRSATERIQTLGTACYLVKKPKSSTTGHPPNQQ